MTNRITIKHLESQCAALNRMTNNPDTYRKDGVIQVCHYRISQAYGGFSLHRVTNTSGGVTDVCRLGHVPARELSNLMFAYVAGMQAGKGD